MPGHGDISWWAETVAMDEKDKLKSSGVNKGSVDDELKEEC